MITDSNINKCNTCISPLGRGGMLLAVPCLSIGLGIVLSGLLSGSPGFYGFDGNFSTSDIFYETTKEMVRVLILALLLLIGIFVESLRKHYAFGSLFLGLIRCITTVLFIECIRIVQLPEGIIRLISISIMQFFIFNIGILLFFSFTLQDAVKFTVSFILGLILLYLFVQLGHWIY